MSLGEKAGWQPGGGVSQAGAGAHVADLQITKPKEQGQREDDCREKVWGRGGWGPGVNGQLGHRFLECGPSSLNAQPGMSANCGAHQRFAENTTRG